jgi:protein SCO1/2
MRFGLWLILAFLLSVPAQGQIASQSFPDFAFHQHPGARLPLNTVLRSETGAPIRLGDTIGPRPAVLVLEYLRCQNLCSLVLSGAVAAMQQQKLMPGRDLDLVAISIDPRDTIADAAAARTMYSRRFADPAAASAGIHFLIGSPADVRRIASVVGFPYRFDRASDQFAHPAGIVVTTPDGRLSRYLLGLNPPPAELREALMQAADERITPPAHPLLLLCFGYDPDPDSAVGLVMRLVRIVSLVVILGLAALILFLLRRRTA